MANLAPIILFVYNRPNHTRKTLESLLLNAEAIRSELYVYADGPRPEANEKEIKLIEETRKIINEKQWCKEVKLICNESNIGLAGSIKNGVTEIINTFGKAIVLEDDIVVSKFFLKYMNDSLSYYTENEEVFHISGYIPYTSWPSKLPETFFLKFMSCWGWATWKRAWDQVIWDIDIHIKAISNPRIRYRFNLNNAIDFDNHLILNKEGKIKTWAIFWFSTIFLKKGLCLYPGESLVNNIGFDGSGQNCEHRDEDSRLNQRSPVLIRKVPLGESWIGKKYLINYYVSGNKFNIISYCKYQIKKMFFFVKNIFKIL